MLIGRAEARAELTAALGAAERGQGSMVLVTGEAGIGKTRLLGELLREAAARGVVTLVGCTFEQDRGYPFAPLADALRTLLADHAADWAGGLARALAPELVKILPELAHTHPGLVPTPALEPEAEKRRLGAAVTQFLRDLASRRPVLLALEDLQWSDATSLEYLITLARRLDRLPLLVVLTHRSEEAPPELARFLAILDRRRYARELELDPLTRHEVEAFLREATGRAGSAGTEFVEALYAATEGNPFLLEEVLRALEAASGTPTAEARWGSEALAELPVPRGVADAVARRLEALPADARLLAGYAAALGQRFELASLLGAAPLAEEAVLVAIHDLQDARLIRLEGDRGLAFRRAFTREAVLAALPSHERNALTHRVAAACLAPGAGPALTPREREVAEFLAGGLTNRELAAALGISERTAETHVSNIMNKLGVNSRLQVALWARGPGGAART